MNNYMEGLKKETNYTITENGAITHKSTLNKILDLFALGGAYRCRTDENCITLFLKAYEQDPDLALKCLFWLRDARQGAGERRFFRVCMKDLAEREPDTVRALIEQIPIFGRWDDLYIFVDTPVEEEAFAFMKEQLAKDIISYKDNKAVSLLGKWLKSCNTSSKESRKLGQITRTKFNMTKKQYRKTLSCLRERIGVLEKLMSEKRWDEIEFDKIPSKAGLIYRNAFAYNDIIGQRYKEFIKNKKTKVNAGTLFPYEVVRKAIGYNPLTSNKVERSAINKYWDNLTDYFNDCTFNGIAVVDTSGSMCGWGTNTIRPIDVAISLGLYCAERAQGPFAGHYISFSSRPQLIETIGVDFVSKVQRIYNSCLIENTNIEAVFDLLLTTAIKNYCSPEEMPQNIIIISDMEFDEGTTLNSRSSTLMESIARKWKDYGYTMPHLIYWNVEARQDNIADLDPDRPISYVSGCSPTIFKQIMTGKTGWELCLETLLNDRYKKIGRAK